MLRIYQSGELPAYLPIIDTANIVCVVIGNRPLEVEWFVKHFNAEHKFIVDTLDISDNYEVAKVFKWK